MLSESQAEVFNKVTIPLNTFETQRKSLSIKFKMHIAVCDLVSNLVDFIKPAAKFQCRAILPNQSVEHSDNANSEEQSINIGAVWISPLSKATAIFLYRGGRRQLWKQML